MPDAPSHGMRPLRDLLDPSIAHKRILETCRPVDEAEMVSLAQAVDRVLSDAVVARGPVPPFDRSAMDGYALRSSDATLAGVTLHVVGAVAAGALESRRLEKGEAVQIATGAPIPPGADAVVMVERTRQEGSTIRLERAVAAGENVSRAGSDLKPGQVVLRHGDVLNPARIAAAAAAGVSKVRVWRAPRVLIVSTGAELAIPGTDLAPGQLHDSNGPALAAFVAGLGALVLGPEHVADDVDALRACLRRSAEADLILTSGGSSAGAHDLLRDAVAIEGEVLFHGVRVKPGKPLLLGRLGRIPILGLPGYPASCLMDAYLFAAPALRAIGRRPPAPTRTQSARLAARIESVPDRLWCVPVRLEGDTAHPTFKESGATTSLAEAHGFVTVPAGAPPIEAGTRVEVTLF